MGFTTTDQLPPSIKAGVLRLQAGHKLGRYLSRSFGSKERQRCLISALGGVCL